MHLNAINDIVRFLKMMINLKSSSIDAWTGIQMKTCLHVNVFNYFTHHQIIVSVINDGAAHK